MSSTTISCATYGKTKNDEDILQYTFTNKNGTVLKVINFGAIITNIHVPNANGDTTDDVVLGYDNIEGYETNPYYFGVMVGRVANRTEHGKFSIDGETYQVTINESARNNHLHGGSKGFHKVVWNGEIKDDTVVLTYVSPDGEEGYPGELTTQCTYQLTNDNEVVITLNATTTKPTPVNMCNHSYFNLSGKKSSIADHSLMINADAYTPLKENLIPTGVRCPVQGTLFDFRCPVVIGDRLDDVSGFDHNFCLSSNTLSDCAARVSHPSGLTMEVYTTQPGLQFYSSNFIDGTVAGKNGIYYEKHGGLCLETQNYPNAVNEPSFPEAVLHPGQVYTHTTIFKFLNKK